MHKSLILIALACAPLFAADKAQALQEQLAAANSRALIAELRAAVAEERLASIPHEQAIERTKAAFSASCAAKGIPLDQCRPTPTWDVERKPEQSKAPVK